MPRKLISPTKAVRTFLATNQSIVVSSMEIAGWSHLMPRADREVKLAPNEKETLKIAGSMIKKNIKKGRNEVTR